jgi:hypothetical protein
MEALKKYILSSTIVLLCIFFLYKGLRLYYDQFPVAFSNEQSHWGAFGDYANTLLNVVNIVLLTWIGIITYRTTLAFNRLQITPLIDFIVSGSNSFNEFIPDTWYMINCSEAAARNIHVRFHIGNELTSKWINSYALQGKDKLEFIWMRYASKIEVLYCDTLATNYYQLIYENNRGTPKRITKKKYDNALKSNVISYADVNLNFKNHADIRLQHRQGIIISKEDHIKQFIVHHKFSA